MAKDWRKLSVEEARARLPLGGSIDQHRYYSADHSSKRRRPCFSKLAKATPKKTCRQGNPARGSAVDLVKRQACGTASSGTDRRVEPLECSINMHSVAALS